MKRLIAGPFVGEFGWEVMQWQGYIRFLSKHYDEVICISRPENEYLYHDFVTTFESFDPGSYNTDLYTCFAEGSYDGKIHEKYPNSDSILFLSIAQAKPFLQKNPQQIFYKYGSEIQIDSPIDFLVHARNVPKFDKGNVKKSSRNWHNDQWDEFVNYLSQFGTVGAIGIPQYSYVPKNCKSLLDEPLDVKCGYMNKAKCIIGPSSGPMHLASVCGCPQIVWTSPNEGASHGGNIKKYTESWNPFRTPVIVYAKESWNPKVSSMENVVKLFQREKGVMRNGYFRVLQ